MSVHQRHKLNALAGGRIEKKKISKKDEQQEKKGFNGKAALNGRPKTCL
jgi:hypothetical protein